MILPIELDIN